jgi:hypothetical protein
MTMPGLCLGCAWDQERRKDPEDGESSLRASHHPEFSQGAPHGLHHGTLAKGEGGGDEVVIMSGQAGFFITYKNVKTFYSLRAGFIYCLLSKLSRNISA